MHIKVMYNITTFKNIFQYQAGKFNNVKSQLLSYQPNSMSSEGPELCTQFAYFSKFTR